MLIRAKDLDTLLQLFESVDVPMEIWAYGSRVNGTAHAGSDLDLVIRSANLQPISTQLLSSLRKKIQESNIPILVELHDWAKLPSPFHKNIIGKHEVIYNNFLMEVNDPPASYTNTNNQDAPVNDLPDTEADKVDS